MAIFEENCGLLSNFIKTEQGTLLWHIIEASYGINI